VVPREGFQVEPVYGVHQVPIFLLLPDCDPTRDGILSSVQGNQSPAHKMDTHKHRTDDVLRSGHRSTGDHLTTNNIKVF
jgi:hypothetical protein